MLVCERMKRIAIVILLLLFAGLQANNTQARLLDEHWFKELFLSFVEHQAAIPDADLVVENFQVRPVVMNIPEGKITYRVVNAFRPVSSGHQSIVVSIAVDSQETGQARIDGDICQYRQVVCLTNRLSRHTILTGDDVVLLRKNIGLLGENSFGSVDDVIGKRLTTSQREGGVLYASILEDPPLVERNDMVTIVVHGQSFRITVPGQVRSAGARGEVVKVKNLMSRKVIYAKVVSGDSVEVDL